MKLKRTQISIENESCETIVMRRQMPVFFSECAVCGGERGFVFLDDAVARCDISTRELIALIDRGVLHATETRAGHLVICAASLDAAMNERCRVSTLT